MKLGRRRLLGMAAGAAALTTLPLQNLAADAAEIKVLSTNAIIPVTNDLFSQFERMTAAFQSYNLARHTFELERWFILG